ncbi:hypothetical protein [Aporhodopirellula aestuarii]|uniref:Uncharacterized protein n=1 Tax=Aporhodopirellula aestuarii TaxID=2950107 RepID=A0ABT0UFD5_9BACT|nr:hypothetical protein [Aporhodopirellula aestuarii]MCM2374861.1 hypothetical protein [Aporhodopirellula aestuarii]
MAKSEQQRQKKLARKKAKDRQKKQQIARQKQQLASLTGKMSAASNGRILHCMVGEFDQGMGSVVLARQAPSGLAAIAIFLLDTYCLGVKDIIATCRNPSEWGEVLQGMADRQGLKAVRPGIARGLVEATAEYAESLGLSPHPDYPKAQLLWGDVEAESVAGLYEFGRNGKPCYVAGPHDDAATQSLILGKLDKNLGRGNYNFVLGGPADGFSLLGSTFGEEDWGDDGVDDDDYEDEDDDPSSVVLGRVESRRIESDE